MFSIPSPLYDARQPATHTHTHTQDEESHSSQTLVLSFLSQVSANLGTGSHGVSFIKNDDLEGRTWLTAVCARVQTYTHKL